MLKLERKGKPCKSRHGEDKLTNALDFQYVAAKIIAIRRV